MGFEVLDGYGGTEHLKKIEAVRSDREDEEDKGNVAYGFTSI